MRQLRAELSQSAPGFLPRETLASLSWIQLVDVELPTAVKPDVWHDLELNWDLAMRQCRVLLDGQTLGTLPLLRETVGVSYLRLSCTAESPETGGVLVESAERASRRERVMVCRQPSSVSGSRLACLTMVYKLVRCAESHWRGLNGSGYLEDVIRGVRFVDGIKEIAA